MPRRGSMMSVALVASIAFALAISLAQIPAATRPAGDARALERPLLATLNTLGITAALVFALIARRHRHGLAREAEAAGEALARSEATRARFLEVIAHDLRQPIQAIELFSAGLGRRHPGADTAPMLEGIRSSLASMRRMLSGLMDISRLDSGVVAPARVDVAIADIMAPIAAEFAPLAAARDLAFEVADGPGTGGDGADGEAAAHTDPVMLECVLRNLVSNALRYTQAGSVSVRCARAGAWLTIAVRDTGPGIAEAELGRIFQEFYRVGATARSTEGLGLGLAIVRRMVRLLDIRLEVASTIGRGTVFTVSVPAARGPVRRAAARGEEADASGVGLALAGARVLLIDDDEQVRRGLGGELRARGMAVTAVAGPAAACALFTRAPDSRFDIALVDRDLGAPLTGPELLDHLATRLGVAIPALLLSGTQDFKVIAELQEAGYPWLSKPVTLDILLREMARIAVHDQPPPGGPATPG